MKFKDLKPNYKYEAALITVFADCGVDPEDDVFSVGDQFMITSSQMYGVMLAGSFRENGDTILVDVPISLNGDPFTAVVKDGEWTGFHY